MVRNAQKAVPLVTKGRLPLLPSVLGALQEGSLLLEEGFEAEGSSRSSDGKVCHRAHMLLEAQTLLESTRVGYAPPWVARAAVTTDLIRALA